MSLSKPQSSPFEILPDLHHEPRVRYPAWKAAIFELAILQCQTQHVSGCLFMVQTDAEYDAFPLHWDAQQQAIQRPAVAFPTIPPHDAPAMIRDGYTRALAHHEAWVTVRANLLAAVVKSVAPADLTALRDPVHGILLLTLPQILAHVLLVHGLVTAADLAAMKAALLEKLASPADFPSHVARFAERAGKIHLEEPIAPTALFALFKETFSHHPSFLSSMSRFYESFPLRTDHTVPNLVAHITPSLPFIIELSSPSHAAFGLLGFPQPPTAASSSAPLVPPSKTALKKAARKGKQGKQRDQHSALLAYMAEQGIAVPPHLAAGALTIPPARPTIPPPPGPRTSMVAPTPGHHYCFVHGWTTSHGWKAGKWAGPLCRTLHAVPSPYSTQQANSQDPSLGGNANVYVVRAAPSCLPSRVSPMTACSLCLPPSTPRENRTKNSPLL